MSQIGDDLSNGLGEDEDQKKLRKAAQNKVKGLIGKLPFVKAAEGYLHTLKLKILGITALILFLIAAVWCIKYLMTSYIIGTVQGFFTELTTEGKASFLSFITGDNSAYLQTEQEEWNTGGDPDDTQLLAETYLAMKECIESGEDYDPDLSDKLPDDWTDEEKEEYKEEFIEGVKDLVREENLYMSVTDTADLLQEIIDYNNDMFRYDAIYYQKLIWSLDYDSINELYSWHKGYTTYNTDKDPSVDNDSGDGKYGILTNLKIEGEEDDTGQKLFNLHWQDVYCMIVLKVLNTPDEWGNTGDTNKFDASDGEYSINDTDGYWISDEDIDTILSLFKYEFNYYYDGVDDTAHDSSASAYSYETLASGGYSNIGYRYKRVADPDTTITYSSRESYTGPDPIYTEFVPESAPSTISNGWDSYIYHYVPVSEVPDYTPDPDVYSPPGYSDGSAQYCVGRWHIINPIPFFDTLNELMPFFYDEEDDEPWDDYKWYEFMMESYAEQLDLIDSTSNSVYGTTMSHSEYFKYLAELYDSKTIVVSYEGTKYDEAEMEEFVEALEHQYCTGIYRGWSVEVSYEDASDEYYTVDDNLSNIPFASYGVTYYYGTGSTSDDDSDDTSTSTTVPSSDDVEMAATGQIYLHAQTTVGNQSIIDGWLTLYGEADTEFCNYNLSLSEIESMLASVTATAKAWGFKEFDFQLCAERLYEYQNSSGCDLPAMFAIAYTEGAWGSSLGTVCYNFWDIAAFGDYNSRKYGGRNWCDFKTYYTNQGMTDEEAFIESVLTAVKFGWEKYYIKRGQKTFYQMCFMGYGYPQSQEEAIENTPKISYSYCPYWDDTGLVTNWDESGTIVSSASWVNRSAQNKANLLAAAGR